MSILIYHGAPGSYKTSSAVQEQLIPVILNGRKVLDDDASTPDKPVFKNEPRPIVTNVRGLTNETVREFFKDKLSDDWLDGCPVINVDTSTAEGREKWARWFHWVPLGAFLIVDEAQHVWPKRWRDADLYKLNFPAPDDRTDYRDAAKVAGRPPDFLTAFDMHRHYNWDLVLTTPDIGKIHPDIRSASEGAYRHKNLAVLGSLFKGRYTQIYHDAGDKGNASDAVTIESKSIKKSTFTLYQSTATGNFSDTKAGTSIFKDPKILILLLLVFAPFGYLAWAGTPSILGGKKSVSTVASGPVAVSGSSIPVRSSGVQVPVQMGAILVSDMSNGSPLALRHPLDGSKLTLIGRIISASKSLSIFNVVDSSGNSFQLTAAEASNMGYLINDISDCASQFVWPDTKITFIVGCRTLEGSPSTGRAPSPVLPLSSPASSPQAIIDPSLQNASSEPRIVVLRAAAK